MKTKSPEGFTLLELLIAISIFSAVISIVYGTYRVTFTTISKAENSIEYSLAAQKAFICIKDDLEQVISDSVTPFEAGYDGTEYSLSFTTANTLLTNPFQKGKGNSKIVYQIEENNDTNFFSLYRTALPIYLDGEETPANKWLLAENVKEIRFIHYDEEGNEQEEWSQDESDEESAITLPHMTRVEFYFPAEDDESEKLFFITIALPMGSENE